MILESNTVKKISLKFISSTFKRIATNFSFVCLSILLRLCYFAKHFVLQKNSFF